jgi:hypothetical protein
VADEEGEGEIGAELAFIQKKIQDGVSKKQRELNEKHQKELEAHKKEAAEREKELSEKHQRELEAHKKEDAEREKALEREYRQATDKLERELSEKFKHDLEEKEESLSSEFAEEYSKQEAALKAEIAQERKALEEELRHRADTELARDKRDLEDTFQTKYRKREEELKAKLEEDLRAGQAEARRTLELEYRQKLTEAQAEIAEELRTRAKELEAAAEKEALKKLDLEKARLESEMARHMEAEEMKLGRENRDKLAELERTQKEKMIQSLEGEKKKIEEAFRVRLLMRGRYSHLSRSLKKPLYPFPAMIGMEKAKRAIILNAINPSVGGTVIWGREGNGKFLLLMSFAELLSPIEKELIGREDEHKNWNDEERYLTGRIHYGREMAGYLTDTYLQCAAISLPHIQRRHDTTVGELPPLLLGSLKEEDEQAYHLISEYTLQVEVNSPGTVEERLEIMHRNSDFRKDPGGFRERYEKMSEEIRSNIRAARDRLTSVTISTRVLALIARMTILDKQSLRLDVLMEQLARTNAAFEGRNEVDSTDVMEAADLALMHRLTPRELADYDRTLGPDQNQGRPK